MNGFSLHDVHDSNGVTLSRVLSDLKAFERDKVPAESRFTKAKTNVIIRKLTVEIVSDPKIDKMVREGHALAVHGVSQADDGLRQTLIVAFGIQTSEDRKAGWYLQGRGKGSFYIQPINKSSTPLKFMSSDPDFLFRFAEPLKKADGLAGVLPPYEPKGSGRPPVNPSGYLGLSKHLLAIVNRLQTMKLLK